ncbi:hypothetical protein EAE91_13845 [Photorhabdus noenieputensis]|nr:hypothetical protein [Photorhabdus noenieputensis]
MKNRFDTKFTEVESKSDSRFKERDNELDSAISRIESSIEKSSLSFDGNLKGMQLRIILWILGLPSLAFALYHAYLLL